MKQETADIMLPNKTQEKNCDLKVINIDFFYKEFLKEKRKYAPSLFCVNTTTRKKRPQKVSFKLYKKIVLEYLKIYFFSFYMTQGASYFPLGGFLKKVTYPKWVRKMKRGNSTEQICGGNKSIGLFWYLRPSQKMYYMVKLKKLTGKYNQLPKIERVYNLNYDKDLLPIFTEEAKRTKKHKNLYLCTLI